eukprot:scaffold84703_cov28-Tisochrysis_lutea.AAC.4
MVELMPVEPPVCAILARTVEARIASRALKQSPIALTSVWTFRYIVTLPPARNRLVLSWRSRGSAARPGQPGAAAGLLIASARLLRFVVIRIDLQ